MKLDQGLLGQDGASIFQSMIGKSKPLLIGQSGTDQFSGQPIGQSATGQFRILQTVSGKSVPSWIGRTPSDQLPIAQSLPGQLTGRARLAKNLGPSANGATLCQPRVTPWERRLENIRGLKARPKIGPIRSGLQPSRVFGTVTQGVALGWRRAGALPLRNGGSAIIAVLVIEVQRDCGAAL